MEPLLRDFARRIAVDGSTSGIRVVGGAAIALLNPSRRVTQDIDVAIVAGGDWSRHAADMAAERGLPADWINDAVAARIPFVGLDEWRELFREGSVTVSVASPRMLLAMKLLANRGRRDTDDIHFLLESCHVTSVDEAAEIFETYHPQDVLSASAEARVRAWLSRDGGPDPS